MGDNTTSEDSLKMSSSAEAPTPTCSSEHLSMRIAVSHEVGRASLGVPTPEPLSPRSSLTRTRAISINWQPSRGLVYNSRAGAVRAVKVVKKTLSGVRSSIAHGAVKVKKGCSKAFSKTRREIGKLVTPRAKTAAAVPDTPETVRLHALSTAEQRLSLHALVSSVRTSVEMETGAVTV